VHESARAVMGWHLLVVATVRSGGMLWTDARELSVVLLIAEKRTTQKRQENREMSWPAMTCIGRASLTSSSKFLVAVPATTAAHVMAMAM